MLNPISNRDLPINQGDISYAFMGNLQLESQEDVTQKSGLEGAFQNVSQLSQEFNLTAENLGSVANIT